MASTSGSDRPRSFFDRFTEPLAERAREKFEQVEDHVREAVQSEIDAVSRSVRARASRCGRPPSGSPSPPS